jgi:NarL family two-component system response regulator LiaR
MTNELPSIVIIEDHPVMREGLANFFAGTGRWRFGGTASSLESAKELLKGITADVILLDINLKDGWGLDIIPWLVQQTQSTQPIFAVYSAYDDWAHVRSALNMGVRAYVTKQRSLQELETALQKALSGSVYIDETAQERLQNTANTLDLLTKREKEIFSLVKSGMTNKEIAAKLNISHKTVANIVSLVYDKIGIRDRLELERL